MKTNRILLLTSVLCFSLLATGCGEPMQELTSEEEAIISLYAAKAVAKFNKNQIIGIANARVKKGELEDEYKPDDLEEDEATGELTEEEGSEEPQIDPETGEIISPPEDGSSDEEGQDAESETADSSQEAGYSFTNAIDIEGVSFTCSDLTVNTEYKPNSSFVLNKISGKKYVVLNIEATNESDATVDFSKYSKREYALSLNGGEKSNSQFTPLTNDLSSYKGKLAAGETKSFVLVFLFSNSTVDNISSLELFVTSDGTTRGTTI
ncbi:hypothetical protein [Pseudobutyrivibrio xylanivorans]|uniref:DUF4352 domain-containing protein n=1 Tax=Pseudobutyrivibrio xylanivorans TaxID=185007 RepID=A0A5P6VSY8_PSEXY|nr:hypothetical protein [Pseudobutyrivibrio xylanivorans]QFJ55706.1 hypothetical protein FXF36_12865 [Pseudobutyrivibrio xylanivorans]